MVPAPFLYTEASLLGTQLLAYQANESCRMLLRKHEGSPACFLTLRIGPVGVDGFVMKEDSIKVSGDWNGEDDLAWVFTNMPLRRMSAKSPAGVVGCRFKVWAKGLLGRHWLGRTEVVAVPTPQQRLCAGSLGFTCELFRGVAAECPLASRVINLSSYSEKSQEPAESAGPAYCQDLGTELLKACSSRQWGIATVLLRELELAPHNLRQKALSQADETSRTALRCCVDGQSQDRCGLLQALEGACLTALLGIRRPYWWTMKILAVNSTTLTILGEVRVGVPRSRGLGSLTARSGPAGVPAWHELCWSHPQELDGRLSELSLEQSKLGHEVGRLHLAGDTELALHLVPPGQAASFGAVPFRNPLGVPLLTANGRIAGTPGAGFFDPIACSKVAAELQVKGPRDAARLAMAIGADPRALADDGFSPYTTALLGEDPCSLLCGFDSVLRKRILKREPRAWAEACHSSSGHLDLAAAPLTLGLATPDSLVSALLDHCFKFSLPLLASRALERVDGQKYFLAALEKAHDKKWLRVAERILQQCMKDDRSRWSDPSTLKYAVSQVAEGRSQFKLLLDMGLSFLHGNPDEDFLEKPCALPQGNGLECPVCFEQLCRSRCLAFVDDDNRAVCCHFLCHTCARSYSAATTAADSLRCPECRRYASSLMSLPSPSEDPIVWFDFLSQQMSKMPRSTLFRAIAALLPIDADTLEAAVDAGEICQPPLGAEVSAADFLADGLFAWVWRHEWEHQRSLARGPAPQLTDQNAWFKYWNVSNSKQLSQAEVFRAVLLTLKISTLDKQRVATVRTSLAEVWPRFVKDKHCKPTVACSYQQFVGASGLASGLLAAFGAEMLGTPPPEPPKEAQSAADRARALSMTWSGPGQGARNSRPLTMDWSAAAQVVDPMPSDGAGVLAMLRDGHDGEDAFSDAMSSALSWQSSSAASVCSMEDVPWTTGRPALPQVVHHEEAEGRRWSVTVNGEEVFFQESTDLLGGGSEDTDCEELAVASDTEGCFAEQSVRADIISL